MTTGQKVNSFIKGFVALVTGDNAKATAERTLRAADSALNIHIHVIDGELIKLEQNVEDAKEKEAQALLNFGRPITDRDDYVQGLVNAHNAVTEAESALDAEREKLNFLKEKLEEINAEVDSEEEEVKA